MHLKVRIRIANFGPNVFPHNPESLRRSHPLQSSHSTHTSNPLIIKLSTAPKISETFLQLMEPPFSHEVFLSHRVSVDKMLLTVQSTWGTDESYILFTNSGSLCYLTHGYGCQWHKIISSYTLLNCLFVQSYWYEFHLTQLIIMYHLIVSCTRNHLFHPHVF